MNWIITALFGLLGTEVMYIFLTNVNAWDKFFVDTEKSKDKYNPKSIWYIVNSKLSCFIWFVMLTAIIWIFYMLVWDWIYTFNIDSISKFIVQMLIYIGYAGLFCIGIIIFIGYIKLNQKYAIKVYNEHKGVKNEKSKSKKYM